jgi:hypothetical protein
LAQDALLYRAGLLMVVRPPTENQESLRDLSRCREDAKEDPDQPD